MQIGILFRVLRKSTALLEFFSDFLNISASNSYKNSKTNFQDAILILLSNLF